MRSAPTPQGLNHCSIASPASRLALMSETAAPTGAAPLPRWKKVLFSSILLVIVLGSLELLASLYLRVTRGYAGRHLYEFEFDPYKSILPARGFVDTRGVRHNVQGFREDSIISRTKPAGTYRIFLMGGSTAYGTGGLWPHLQREFAVIPNEKTIDSYLERVLADSLPGVRVEVVNAAITSTWTHHHLIYLNQTILGFDPDMVLFLDGFNDGLFFGRGHDQFGSFLYNTQASGILGPPTLRSLVQANGWWIYRRSAFAHVTIRALRDLKLLVQRPRGERKPMDVELALTGLREVFPRNALKMHRRAGLILRDEGVTPVFMLQPMLILERARKPMNEIEQKLFDFNVSSYLPNYERFAHEATRFIASEEQSMAQSIGGEFIDLTRIYEGVQEQIFTDYVHLTPAGNERLARAVASRILPLIHRDLARGESAGVTLAGGAAARADSSR